MIYVNEFLDENFVWFLDQAPKEVLLKRMAEGLAASPHVRDAEAFQNAVLERESLMSTGLGLGLAIPHVKIDSIDDMILGLGIVPDGAEWDALDGEPVKLIFLFAAGAHQHKAYLQLLSKVILVMKNAARREKLMAATTVQEVIQLFTGV